MKKKQFIISGVAVAVILVAGSFYGGISYAHAHPSFTRSTLAGQFGQAGQGGAARGGFTRNGMMGGATAGQIVSVDSTTITIKMPNGSTQLVMFTGSTQIAKSVAGSMSDLRAGTSVLVAGQSNSDGSVSAQTIQIRPSTTTQAY